MGGSLTPPGPPSVSIDYPGFNDALESEEVETNKHTKPNQYHSKLSASLMHNPVKALRALSGFTLGIRVLLGSDWIHDHNH